MVNTWLANRTRTITSPQHPTLELPLGTYFMREEAFPLLRFLAFFFTSALPFLDFQTSERAQKLGLDQLDSTKNMG